ncbi:MAG: hypothetical protein ACRD1T_00710, partial [Acidimicrobiia bacterium]
RGVYLDEYEVCRIDYPGWEGQRVALNRDGSFDQETADTERENCRSNAEDARISAEDGYPWSEQPKYYERTGICTPGRP